MFEPRFLLTRLIHCCETSILADQYRSLAIQLSCSYDLLSFSFALIYFSCHHLLINICLQSSPSPNFICPPTSAHFRLLLSNYFGRWREIQSKSHDYFNILMVSCIFLLILASLSLTYA